MPCAEGAFEVRLNPQSEGDDVAVAAIGRMSIDKQFQGDLEATSRGQMLSAGTDVQGSAGYVALERVDGMLHGKRGTFVLQHNGTMTRGTPQLTISMVPDSGTGELSGLAGTMDILINHSYDFTYTLLKAS